MSPRAESKTRSRRSVPTLGELQRQTPRWTWLHCAGDGCNHSSPAALAPFVIRWGAGASSDVLRERARCSQCGRLGATLRHPSWVDMGEGFAPFPFGGLMVREK